MRHDLYNGPFQTHNVEGVELKFVELLATPGFTPGRVDGDLALEALGLVITQSQLDILVLGGLDDHEVDLTAYEYNLLEHLMLHAGEMVSKTELTDKLYDQDFDRDSNVIEVFVGRLRRKIDPCDQTKPIKTVRGQGYRFEA